MTERADATRRRSLLWKYAAYSALGLLGALAASYFLARRMVRPIRALGAGADEIGAGQLHKRIELRTGDELETLGAPRLRRSDPNLRGKPELAAAQPRPNQGSESATLNGYAGRWLSIKTLPTLDRLSVR